MKLSGILLYLFINTIRSDVMDNYYLNDSTIESKNKYDGYKFPHQYLAPEITLPNVSDLVKYLENLNRTVSYFNRFPNSTDCNIALGAFYTKVLLKRTLKDYKIHIVSHYCEMILDIIRKCENMVSHYVYANRLYGWQDEEYRLSRLFIDDIAQVYSISPFNKGHLKQWLHSNSDVHDYAEDMDDISLPRLKYLEFVLGFSKLYLQPSDSDFCISSVTYNPEPIHLTTLQLCRPNRYCFELLHSSPSIAYALSHRLLNILIRHQMRRCYLKSAEEDSSHIDLLCAFMYRETVYLARRGFFVRDMFLEHVAICAMRGYEEFHRRNWFNKILSWMNDEGCIQENPNCEYNATSLLLKRNAGDEVMGKKLRRELRNKLCKECHDHPMALVMIVLAHGIRYAVHYKSEDTLSVGLKIKTMT